MALALSLGRRGQGNTWPNPAVGCVIVQEGRVVGRGWTQPGGRPHAETEALRRAGEAAAGATAYVTLEPCAHTGKTPPCAEALIEAKVSRVVVAIEDPDPRVAGQGVAMLHGAGIEVEVGCCADEARHVNAGFLSRIERNRPWVSLKVATTLDGKIATRTGHSQWITGEAARQRGHLLRAVADVILTGGGTVAADDPQMTCRLPGLEKRSPRRAIMLGSQVLSPDAKLVQTASDVPVRIYTAEGRDTSGLSGLALGGIDVRSVPGSGSDRPSASAVLADLAADGVTRVLVEAGAALNAAFLAEELVDEVHWFRAPTIMGADGLAAVGDMGHDMASALKPFRLVRQRAVEPDVYEVYVRQDGN